MAKILVTGGPVHAKLDAVKIVTNRFKGGRMAQLADELAKLGHAVTYLCSNGSVEPQHCAVRYHAGFDDYAALVPSLAREHDMAVLGAAVANLIPRPTAWSTDVKFPSHDYKPGDVVNIPFVVAPRVIDEVKKANSRCTLVGFKLLSGVSRDELVRAAYGTLLGAHADLVVANDALNLDEKLLVTKERSVIPADEIELRNVISDMANDRYYRTEVASDVSYRVVRVEAVYRAADGLRRLVAQFGQDIERPGRTPEGFLFGCVAVRVQSVDGFDGFVCSTRGKNDLAAWVYVQNVNHGARVVHVVSENGRKASLNAPLLERIFWADSRVQAIVHTHRTGTGLPLLPYAPPGTVRDTVRDLGVHNFEIEHHGAFYLERSTP